MVRAMMAAVGIGGTRAGDKPQHQAAVQRDDIRGIQLLSHQNGRARQAQRLVGLAPSSTLTTGGMRQDIARHGSRMYGSSSARMRPAKMPAARSTDAAAPAPTRI